MGALEDVADAAGLQVEVVVVVGVHPGVAVEALVSSTTHPISSTLTRMTLSWR